MCSGASPQIRLLLRESCDPDGRRRLAPIGELDQLTSAQLCERVTRLREDAVDVRLDLSQLAFIDCWGILAIIHVMAVVGEGRRPVQVDRLLSTSARRLVELTGLASALWPAGERDAGWAFRSRRRPSGCQSATRAGKVTPARRSVRRCASRHAAAASAIDLAPPRRRRGDTI